MKKNSIKIDLNNFRAIEEANIILDGITVVSGVNGCGKSTISKLLYYTFKNINEFDKLVVDINSYKLNQYRDIYNVIIDTFTLRHFKNFSERRFVRNQFNSKFQIPYNFHQIGLDIAINNIKEAIEIIKSLNISDMGINRDTERLISIIKSELINMDEKHKKNLNQNYDLSHIIEYLTQTTLDDFRSIIYKIFDEYDSKPRKYLDDIIMNVFKTDSLPEKFNIYEYDSKIISNQERKITSSYLVHNPIYIDTPMAFKSHNNYHEYWNDLNLLLDHDSIDFHNRKILEDIENNILHANISTSQNSFLKQFIYNRINDNLSLELESCATGIKSISIIYLLIKNGIVNKKSLLILDEPEAHLHPQWVVEYARILTLIRKEVGCNIFISSHSPDFIQAIKNISEKENLLDDINFYLAEESQGGFIYKHLEKNIGPIFKCFNKSLEKIEKYSLTE